MGPNEYFFTSIHPGVKIYLQKFAAYFTKMFFWKKMFCMQLQDYIKTMILDFINKRIKMLNFITFEIVLLATINSCIVTASFLLNLYSCY